jgi:hypothetical protein
MRHNPRIHQAGYRAARAFIDAVNWALLDAGFILNINARLGNYIGHELTSKFDSARKAHLTMALILTMRRRGCPIKVST